jgi:hypothetical protein
MNDPKRYKIAPWRGRYGDQAHYLRVNPHLPKIQKHIEKKKRQLLRVQEQLRQLETLETRARGVIVEGVLVREYKGPPERNLRYEISLVSDHERRRAEIYPNARNKGKTFGLQIHGDTLYSTGGENRGWGHTHEQAIEGARAWVLRKEKQPARYDRKDGSIREEP